MKVEKGEQRLASSFFFFGKRFEDASQLVAAARQSRDNVFGGRLQQADEFTEQFLLAFDGGEAFELVSTDVDAGVDEGTLQCGLRRRREDSGSSP